MIVRPWQNGTYLAEHAIFGDTLASITIVLQVGDLGEEQGEVKFGLPSMPRSSFPDWKPVSSTRRESVLARDIFMSSDLKRDDAPA